MSRVSDFLGGADAVSAAEGNTDGHAIASVRLTSRGLRPWHVRELLAREPGKIDQRLHHVSRRRALATNADGPDASTVWSGTRDSSDNRSIVGDGLNTALAVGLKVDVDALPGDLIASLKKGQVDLKDPGH